jgi:hypothetical protein
MPPRAVPPPGPAAVLLPEPAPRVPGRRPPIRTGHSPPESVQTNPPTPTTPQRTLGASVMPSGELLRHGRYLGPPQLRHLDVLPLHRPRPHRKRGRATAGKYVLVNPDRVNWGGGGRRRRDPALVDLPGCTLRTRVASLALVVIYLGAISVGTLATTWQWRLRHQAVPQAPSRGDGRRRALNRPVRPRVS